MTHVTSDVTIVTTKMADNKYAHASMLFAIVTAKQHKKPLGSPLVTNLLAIFSSRIEHVLLGQ